MFALIGCSYKDATCMVTIGEGKFFSLGLDLEWMVDMNFLKFIEYSGNAQKLFARILTFPLVTVAALNGEHVGVLCAFCDDGDGILTQVMLMPLEHFWPSAVTM